MSVLARDRKESKFEVITFSVKIHDMLIELMRRNFGIKDLDQVVRIRYATGKDVKEDFAKYRFLLTSFKERLDRTASLMTSNVRAAYSIYPTNMREYEQKRGWQNDAIANCEQLVKELQQIVKTFDVDINIYKEYITAIDREIGLIKRWRQRGNQVKAYVEG